MNLGSIPRAALIATLTLVLFSVPTTAAVAAPGDLDPSFGGDGVVLQDFGRFAEAGGVAVGPDGRVVIAGVTERSDPHGHTERVLVARFRVNGRLDRTFADEGKRIVDLPGNRDRAAGIAITASGRIAVGVGTGSIDHYGDEFFSAGVLQLRRDGSVDRPFGRRGLALVGKGIPNELEIASDGDLVLGSTYAEGQGCCQTGVTRIDADGSPDRRFSEDGFEPTGDVAETRIGFALAGGRAYVSATDGSDGSVRVTAVGRSGAPAAAFDGPGSRAGSGRYSVPGAQRADAATVDGSGRLVVGVAQNAATAGALRILSSGETDAGFGPGGLSAGDFPDATVGDILADAGDVVVLGSGARLATRRVEEDGQNDSGWGEGGTTEDEAGRLPFVVDSATGVRGIVVAGSARVPGGHRTRVLLARYED